MKYEINFKSIIRKGIKEKHDPWGAYMVTGYQGTGKTAFCVFYTENKYKDYKIKTNIKSLSIKGRTIEYFGKLEEILNDYEENVIYIIDEVSKKYPKHSKSDVDFYGWLQQCRKRKRIVFLVLQEFKECPLWLRRPVRYLFTSRRRLGLVFTSVGDAQECTLDENMEWTCPTVKVYIWKLNKVICSMYDTYEPIEEL